MSKPNVIFILPDQHNFAVAGYEGDPYVRTPNLNRLAAAGTVFSSCYSNSPLCVPSRSSMLTGRLPSQNGVYNNMQTLSSSDPTFVHSLTGAGYETVLAGRMHFTGYDQRHGFLKRLVGDLTPSFPGTDNEWDVYHDLMRTSNQSPISLEKSGWGDSAVLHYDREVCQSACAFLRDYTADKPLFMTIGFYGPHCPYVAPRELYEYYYRILPEISVSPEEFQSMHPAMQNWFKERGLHHGVPSPEETRRVRAAYYALVEQIDTYVGTILETVSQTIGFENTIILYASDHGDNIGEHGLFWKTNFYEGSAHVPCIFRWDGHIPSGARNTALMSLLDISATLLDFAQASPLPLSQGESLVPTLTDGVSLSAERYIISQLGDIKGDAPSAMIRQGNYKLIAHCGYNQFQLFDLAADPGELHDLGTSPAYGRLIHQLSSILFQYWNPEEEGKKLKTALRQYRILQDWAKAAKPEPLEEWRGNPEENYVYP